MTSFLENLEWRAAVKGFQSQTVLDGHIRPKIEKAIQLAPTSFGLQPFYALAVTDSGVKKLLRKSGWDQNQFETAQVIYVFVARTDVQKRIDEFVHLIKKTEPVRAKTIGGYEKMMRGSLESRSQDELKAWASKQIYIALGFAMAACAELKIGSCPLEGFLPEEFDKILKLPPGHFSTVALAVGHADPAIPSLPKLRFPSQDLVKHA